VKRGIGFFKSAFLILAFALVVLVCTTNETQAFVAMSEDQVTCTPCHNDGRKGDGNGGEIHAEPSAPAETGEGPVAEDPILTKYQSTAVGNLTLAPAANWDDIWSWVQAQPSPKIENKFDEAFEK
jgi:Cu-Zn family superoxide dismutase